MNALRITTPQEAPIGAPVLAPKLRVRPTEAALPGVKFEKALDAASASLSWPVIPQIAERAFKANHSTACFTKEALGRLRARWRGAVLLAEPEML
jgi:hypothetical protein